MGLHEGNIMSRYNNPRSKRKQKARAKRQAAEMCTYHNTHALDESQDAAWCISPDEFIRREQRVTFTKQEQVTVKRKRVRKVEDTEPRQVSAAA